MKLSLHTKTTDWDMTLERLQKRQFFFYSSAGERWSDPHWWRWWMLGLWLVVINWTRWQRDDA